MGLLLAPVVYQLCLECSILRDASPAVLWSNNVDMRQIFQLCLS